MNQEKEENQQNNTKKYKNKKGILYTIITLNNRCYIYIYIFTGYRSSLLPSFK